MPSNISRNMACSARQRLAAEVGNQAAVDQFQAIWLQSARCFPGMEASSPFLIYGEKPSRHQAAADSVRRMWEGRE
jgi:hypothetical protein